MQGGVFFCVLTIFPLTCDTCAVPCALCKRMIVSRPQWRDQITPLKLISCHDNIYLCHDSGFLHLLLVPVDIDNVYRKDNWSPLLECPLNVTSQLIVKQPGTNSRTLIFKSLVRLVTAFHSNCVSKQ